MPDRLVGHIDVDRDRSDIRSLIHQLKQKNVGCRMFYKFEGQPLTMMLIIRRLFRVAGKQVTEI